MKKAIYLLFITVILFLFSCRKEEEKAPETKIGYNYAGLYERKFVIYDVDSTFYNVPFNIIQHHRFELKEWIESKYTDAEGNDAFRIVRYKKDTTISTNWIHQVVWNATINKLNYQKVEDNIRYVKLIFPIKEDKTWNGNSMNTLAQWDYEYESIHTPETIGGKSFDSVTTVTQFDDENINLIQRQFYQEKFAVNVGMVYKRIIDIDKKYNNGTGLFENSEGVDITYTFKSTGYE